MPDALSPPFRKALADSRGAKALADGTAPSTGCAGSADQGEHLVIREGKDRTAVAGPARLCAAGQCTGGDTDR